MQNGKKIRWNVLSAIEYVCEQTKGRQLKYEKTAKMMKTLERLSSYFNGINETQVIILCALIDMNLSHLRVEGVSKYLGMPTLKYLRHNAEIEDLDSRGIIYVDFADDGHKYSLEEDIVAAILRNEAIGSDSRSFDTVTFVSDMSSIARDHFMNPKVKSDRCVQEEEKNRNQTFVRDVKAILDIPQDRLCFYDICCDYVEGFETILRRTFQNVYGPRTLMNINSMLSGNHTFLQRGIVDFCKRGNVNDSTITLTDKAKEMLLGENAHLYESKLDQRSVITPESIMAKQLFYSEENQNQIEMLRRAMQQENLLSIQDGLRCRGLPIGICVLLYGAPGTGKTESVYQLAKATGRDIVHVDISKTKSCWFGESEKLIENIFVNYRSRCQKYKDAGKNTPILLFNEADAILQRRTALRGNSTEKTENAIQNIILENMEKFEGILIATTNLALNLDAAFERRFLFKIKFDNPSVQAKTAIWQSKLSWLNEGQAAELAERYEFSGGEIDNVVRKAAMEEILTGTQVSMDKLEKLCDAEKISRAPVKRHIGFVAS